MDEDGRLAYRLDRVDGRFVVLYSNGLQFTVAPQLPENHPDLVRVSSSKNLSESTKAHFLTNHIVPMIKAWKGATVLHSSSVHFQSGCIGFFGRSGAGKSTLANMLSLKHGFSFWSDDWFEIRMDKGKCVSTFYPSQTRLHPEHTIALKKSSFLDPNLKPVEEDEKLIFTPPSPSQEKKSNVWSLYELIPSEPEVMVHCDRLSPAAAFQSISLNIFRMDTRNREHMKREYTQIVQIVETIPIFRFYYPHHIGQMESSLQFIEDHIKESDHHP